MTTRGGEVKSGRGPNRYLMGGGTSIVGDGRPPGWLGTSIVGFGIPLGLAVAFG